MENTSVHTLAPTSKVLLRVCDMMRIDVVHIEVAEMSQAQSVKGCCPLWQPAYDDTCVYVESVVT